MAPERRVPIQKSELSILDNEFSSIRERFEAEMKKMEEEMSRFRSQLLDHERDFFSRAPGPQVRGCGRSQNQHHLEEPKSVSGLPYRHITLSRRDGASSAID